MDRITEYQEKTDNPSGNIEKLFDNHFLDQLLERNKHQKVGQIVAEIKDENTKKALSKMNSESIKTLALGWFKKFSKKRH